MAESGRLDVWLSFGLAFVGGYGDAASFVLAKTFTGHVTGNLVLGAIAVAARDWRATLGHLSAIVTFLIGVLLSSSVLPYALSLRINVSIILQAHEQSAAQPDEGKLASVYQRTYAPRAKRQRPSISRSTSSAWSNAASARHHLRLWTESQED